MKVIYLAGGCFWGVERLFQAMPGVKETNVGYASAAKVDAEKANYGTVCTGRTGLRETVKVIYDENEISLTKLLDTFFAVVSVDTPGQQGPDVGDQYQAAIYWADEESKETVLSYAAKEEAKLPRGEFAVDTEALGCYYEAEEAHQKYLTKYPAGYCHISMKKIKMLTGEE